LWSLGHRLCAAAADRKYVRSLPDIQAIAVVHASAWTLAAGAGGTTPEPRLARVGCARRAAHWLALNLAGDSLAEVPAAEALIAAVVEARARRHEEALQAVEEAQRKAEQARQMAARARAAEQEARRAEERRAAAAERARVEREAAARERERDREREREEEREQHQHVHHSAPLYRS
jgi:flagellar biosynthesis GTPase FlhF